MKTQDSKISLNDAINYFVSILPEIRKAIDFRINTVSLVKGTGRDPANQGNIPANDNALGSPPPEPVSNVRAKKKPSVRSVSNRSLKVCEARPVPAGLRPITAAEVRNQLSDDDDLPDDILVAVFQDFTRAVEKGDFRGKEDRRLIFWIVQCRAIKAIRPRTRFLLRTMLATATSEVSEAVDLVPDHHTGIEDELPDYRRALQLVRPFLDELTDYEQALLTAKLDGSLHEFAVQRGEKPATVRGRAKRLLDRLVRTFQEETRGNLRIAAGM